MFGPRIAVSRENGRSGVRVVVAKESDVTERMIHTGAEQIQGKETRNFRDWGPRIGEKKGGGGWASWTAQALFAWTRTHDEPRKSGTCGYIAAGLLLTCQIGARGACAVLDCWRQGIAWQLTVACSMPASVYSRVARKRKFSTLSLRSAVENSSFSTTSIYPWLP